MCVCLSAELSSGRLWVQVVEDVTEFYKQTYANYKDTRQEALKETLRLIHFGVRRGTGVQDESGVRGSATVQLHHHTGG